MQNTTKFIERSDAIILGDVSTREIFLMVLIILLVLFIMYLVCSRKYQSRDFRSKYKESDHQSTCLLLTQTGDSHVNNQCTNGKTKHETTKKEFGCQTVTTDQAEVLQHVHNQSDNSESSSTFGFKPHRHLVNEKYTQTAYESLDENNGELTGNVCHATPEMIESTCQTRPEIPQNTYQTRNSQSNEWVMYEEETVTKRKRMASGGSSKLEMDCIKPATNEFTWLNSQLDFDAKEHCIKARMSNSSQNEDASNFDSCCSSCRRLHKDSLICDTSFKSVSAKKQMKCHETKHSDFCQQCSATRVSHKTHCASEIMNLEENAVYDNFFKIQRSRCGSSSNEGDRNRYKNNSRIRGHATENDDRQIAVVPNISNGNETELLKTYTPGYISTMHQSTDHDKDIFPCDPLYINPVSHSHNQRIQDITQNRNLFVRQDRGSSTTVGTMGKFHHASSYSYSSNNNIFSHDQYQSKHTLKRRSNDILKYPSRCSESSDGTDDQQVCSGDNPAADILLRGSCQTSCQTVDVHRSLWMFDVHTDDESSREHSSEAH